MRASRAGGVRPGDRGQAPLRAAVALAAAGVLLLAVAVAQQEPSPPEPPPLVPAAEARPLPAGAAPLPAQLRRPALEGARPRVAALPPSPPVRLRIDRLDLTASIVDLGLDESGRLEVPASGAPVGWYAAGSAPGVDGRAVLAGHVTWDGEPAVFFRLAELRPGDRIDVQREDGTQAVFSVSGLTRHPKDAFPSARVFGHADRPVLHLVTCTGRYDETAGRHLDNLVVEASYVGTAETAPASE